MTLMLETHAIQTPGPNCINRDDVGAPKTAPLGGVERARVSSQCWKRAVRLALRDTLGQIRTATRTTKIGIKLKDMLEERGVPADQSAHIAALLAEASGAIPKPKEDKDKSKSKDDTPDGPVLESKALLLMGDAVYDLLADKGLEAYRSGDPDKWAKDKAIRSELQLLPINDKAIDVILFGRMAAANPTLNVDACCRFAHAIGVDRLRTEADFYTAIDEVKETHGSAMMDDILFNSPTYYRYADIDLETLADRLADPKAAAETAGAFTRAFATVMPTGKSTTFANITPPDYYMVVLRDTQSYSLVNAFTSPVSEDPIPYHAAERLAGKELSYEKAWGVNPVKAWLVASDTTPDKLTETFGQPVSINTLVNDVQHEVEERLSR